MIGPLTETQSAAIYYRETFGWPVGSTTRAVWICVPANLVGLAVPEPLAELLTISAPTMRYPGQRPLLVSLLSMHTPLNRAAISILNKHNIIQLGRRSMLDLPPTRITEELADWTTEGIPNPATETTLTWAQPPTPGQCPPTLDDFMKQLEMVANEMPMM